MVKNMNRIIGIENELIVSGEGVNEFSKFGSMAHDIAELTKKPFYSFSSHHSTGYMLWNGSVMYPDGGAAEVTSAASEIRRGCVTECVDSLFSARNMLFDAMEKYNRKNNSKIILGAYSGHYNISIENEEYNRLFDLASKSIGMPCMLLIEKRDSKGVMVRDKAERIEFCGEYLPSYSQNIAAMAFMLGAVNAMREREIELPFELKRRKSKKGESDVLWPGIYTPFFLKKGRDAEVTAMLKNGKREKMKAQKAFEEYFAFFRDDIEKIAPNEIKTLEDYVKGNLQLDIDKKGAPKNYKPAAKTKDVDMEPRGIAKYFARAVNGSESFRGYQLKTSQIDWEEVQFYMKRVDNSFTYFAKVARGMLSRFYSDVDAAKSTNDSKKMDELIKNIRNGFYSGEPHPENYGGE